MRTPIRAIPPILAAVAMMAAGSGCTQGTSDQLQPAGASETRAELKDALLRPSDLPGEWEPVAEEDSKSENAVDLDGIRPASCAKAVDRLRSARAHLTAPDVPDAAVRYATGNSKLQQAIMAVPEAESTDFLLRVEAMVDACKNFTMVNAGGTSIAGHMAAADLGQGADGYALIESLTDGAGFEIQQAYVYLVHEDKLAALVFTTREESVGELDLDGVVAAARERFES